jgi:hypothetical protein
MMAIANWINPLLKCPMYSRRRTSFPKPIRKPSNNHQQQTLSQKIKLTIKNILRRKFAIVGVIPYPLIHQQALDLHLRVDH